MHYTHNELERIAYINGDTVAAEYYAKLADSEGYESAIEEKYSRRQEITEEQIYFSRELIEQIKTVTCRTKRIARYKETKTLIEQIERLIEDSFFED